MESYLRNNTIIKNKIKIFHIGTRDNKNINVLKCIDTGVLFLDKNIQTNYKEHNLNYWKSFDIKEAREKTYEDDHRRKLLVESLLKEKSKILDFGCGNGGFLNLLEGGDKFGIELNKEILKILEKEKLSVKNDINEFEEKFDLICMFHVLEHLDNPIEILKDIKSKMEKDSTLIVEVPHANDALIKKYDCEKFKDFTFWSEHLVLYTKETLKKVLELSGFKNIEISGEQRYNIFNHLHWISKGVPGGDKKFGLSDTNLIQSYNNFLKDNDMTDTLIAKVKIN